MQSTRRCSGERDDAWYSFYTKVRTDFAGGG